jgi:hypothetical protein
MIGRSPRSHGIVNSAADWLPLKQARGLCWALALPCVLVSVADVAAADKFQRLSGAQIKSAFAGMELSDDVHWRERYERSGVLSSQSMGRKRTGKWRVEKNELCLDLGAEQNACYQVWRSGKKIEFRRDGLEIPMVEGTLQNPGGAGR